jgi:XTP/dITP diphosphohydrolase
VTRRLLLATRSRHKIGELEQMLALPGVELVSPDDVGIAGEPIEDAETFEANAEIKARFYASRSGLPTLADDSGLEVDALEGGPGVYTKRYAGEDASDDDNNRKLLGALAGLPAERRGARYICVLAFLDPGSAEVIFSTGTFDGRITTVARGQGGFGYDPIFQPLDEPIEGRTVAQMSAAEKNARSHRGAAAARMAARLRERGW